MSSGNYINVGYGITLDVTVPFSIGTWFEGAAGQQGIMLSRLASFSPYDGWELNVNTLTTDNKPSFWLIGTWWDGTQDIQVNTTNPVLDGTWHHILVAYDGSTNAANIKFYVHGSLNPTVVRLGGTPITITNDAPYVPLYFGGRGGSDSQPFTGDLAEVSIWNAALTPQNALSIYLYGPVQINLTGVRTSSSSFALSWGSLTGMTYTVWSSTNLASSWTQLVTGYPSGGTSSTTTTYTDTGATGSPKFYRVSQP